MIHESLANNGWADDGNMPGPLKDLTLSLRKLKRVSGASVNCGWMYDEPVLMLYSLIKWMKPEIIVQTGHLWGKSALVALAAQNDRFLNDLFFEVESQTADPRCAAFVSSNAALPAELPILISVDPDPKGVPHPEESIAWLKERFSNFEFLRMTSSEYFENHAEALRARSPDARLMGIVDGDHTWAGALADLEALSRMKADMILVDDTSWYPHILSAAKQFARRHGYEMMNLPLYTGFAILYRQDDARSRLRADAPRTPLKASLLYRLGGRRMLRLLPFIQWASLSHFRR